MLGFTADHSFVITVIKMIIIIIIIIIKIMLLVTVEYTQCYLLFRYLLITQQNSYYSLYYWQKVIQKENFPQPSLESLEVYMTYLRFFLPVTRASTSQAQKQRLPLFAGGRECGRGGVSRVGQKPHHVFCLGSRQNG